MYSQKEIKEEFVDDIPLLCHTCLSSDRKLSSISGYRELCTKLFTGLNLICAIEDICMCWECLAVVRRVVEFINKVRVAQKENEYKALSTLSQATKDSYDLEIKYQIEKDEPEFGSDFHYSPDHDEYTDGNECKADIATDEESTKLNSEQAAAAVYHEIKIESVDVRENAPGVREKRLAKKKRGVGKVGGFREMFVVKAMSGVEMLRAREEDKRLVWYLGSPYKCELCLLCYKREEKYLHHLETRHSETCGKYTCDICEVRLPDKKQMAAHCETHYRRYQCRLCHVTHHQLRVMRRHYIREHERRKYACVLCQKEFSSWRALRYHRDIMHKEKPKCKDCGRVFPNESNLKRHLLLHTETPLLQCHICNKSYKGAAGLKAHLRFHDPTTATEDAYCAECNLQFKNTFLYRSHLKKSSKHITPDVKKHECKECGKRFLEKIFLKRHYDGVHLKKREHVCHICSKMYIKEYSLRQHIKLVHEGEKRPKDKVCDICHKRFTSKEFLKQHMNSHTGHRPYECAQCSASFGYSSALYMHTKRIHLREKRDTANAAEELVNTM